jgi:hypothetical protein
LHSPLTAEASVVAGRSRVKGQWSRVTIHYSTSTYRLPQNHRPPFPELGSETEPDKGWNDLT